MGYASTSASDEISQSVLSGGIAQHSPPWTIHDHGSFGPGSRLGGQPMTPAPTGFVEPRPINLNIPSSPMQLGFFPDDPKPSSSVSPALSFSQHKDGHYHSRSPPRGLGLGHSTAPTVLNPLQQVDGTEEDDDNGSSPVPSSQDTTAASNSSNSSSSDTTKPLQPGILETQTRFESVAAHTAKCDLCNSRNDAGMSRCLSCGWQSCHGCTLKNGCTRTHKAGSRVHTGPIDSSQLIPTGESSRGKKKGQGRGRGKSRSRAVHQSRLRIRDDNDNASPKRFARQEGVDVRTKQSHAHTTDDDRNIDASSSKATVRASANTLSSSAPSPLLASSSPINRQPSSPTTADDPGEARENMLEGARNLFAFSFEAYMTWTHEQGAKNRDQQEETSRAEEWEPFVDVEDFHLYAQKEATRVFEEYRWQN